MTGLPLRCLCTGLTPAATSQPTRPTALERSAVTSATKRWFPCGRKEIGNIWIIQSVKKENYTIYVKWIHHSLKRPKISQCTYVQKPLHAEIRAMFMCSLQQMLHVVSMHFNQILALCRTKVKVYRKFMVSLESPDILLHTVIPTSHWSTLNTPKNLDVPTAKNPED
jgi:hypothetical protein